MFQLTGREDARRLVVDWIDAVFGCRSLPGARYLFDLWRRRCALGNQIDLFGMPTNMTERVRRPVHDAHQSTWSTLDPLLANGRHPASGDGQGEMRSVAKGYRYGTDRHPLTAAETTSG